MALALDLSGRVVLVTGGTRGIGLGIAETFRAAGATVVTCSRSEVEGASDHHVCDVRDPEAVGALLAAIVEAHGRLDVLVNNAGGAPYAAGRRRLPALPRQDRRPQPAQPRCSCAQAANAVMQRQEAGGVDRQHLLASAPTAPRRAPRRTARRRPDWTR